jgi:hypothetical protein
MAGEIQGLRLKPTMDLPVDGAPLDLTGETKAVAA